MARTNRRMMDCIVGSVRGNAAVKMMVMQSNEHNSMIKAVATCDNSELALRSESSVAVSTW